MASSLSPSAIRQIMFLVENDDRPTRNGKEQRTPRNSEYELMPVNSKWRKIYLLYMDIKPAPPLVYLDSFELGLFFKGEVDDADVRAIFARGKPLVFWGCPRLLVPNIVQVRE